MPAGAVGLPPVGASPSVPEHGELLATLTARPGTRFPGSFVPVHQIRVYSDGRVIWRREDRPGPANGVATGYLEQRLAPEGVELVRSELLSTGLFDRDGYYLSEQGLSWGEIEVHNGDRLVTVDWCCPALIPAMNPGPDATSATPRQTRALIRLSEGLADLTSWLPASAWEDAEPMAYVPSRYAICYRKGYEPGLPIGLLGTDQSLAPSRVLGELPAPAQDLLTGKDAAILHLDKSEGPADHEACSEVTIAEARALAEILTNSGFERDPYPAMTATYGAKAPDPIGILFVSFEPILPHGQWEQMGG